MKIVSLKESLRNDAILNCMVTGLFSYANQQLPWVPEVFFFFFSTELTLLAAGGREDLWHPG